MATKKMSVAGLKKWAKENKELAKAVCLAKAFAEVERERVNAYVEPIFAKYEFFNDFDSPRNTHKGERLTKSDQLYLSKDEELAAKFYAEVEEAHRAHGYKGEEGTCPALVAENILVKAENILLGSLGEFMGLGKDQTFTFSSSHGGPLETRKWMIEHALTACLGKLT